MHGEVSEQGLPKAGSAEPVAKPKNCRLGALPFNEASIQWNRPVASGGEWLDLGSPSASEGGFVSVAVGRNQDGRLEAFILQTGELWHSWQPE